MSNFNNQSGSSRQGRPAYRKNRGSQGGGQSSYGRYGNSSAATRRQTAGGSRRSRRGNKNDSTIDVSKFVNKATAQAAAAPFVPKHHFADFKINNKLKENILAKGYQVPTPIQDQTIPELLQGSDVVGIANTGTGKTAAFLIPLINKVLYFPRERVLIMAPTRELALQIEQELKEFTKNLHISSVCCVGGSNIRPQMVSLKRNPNFVIGTPGRLKDLMERNYLDLVNFKSVVLDEADRMLDMGFIDDMRFMLSHMPDDRQTLFFSATFSKEIEALTSQFSHQPVRVSVKTRETASNVDQDIIRINSSRTKLDVLHDLLSQEEFRKVLVFGRTKRGVDRLSRDLAKRGFKIEPIHGDKSQNRRERALRRFKENQVQVLIATDVAARGLDISDITHVINYDIPTTYEDYIHRIGRTGRGHQTGKALTFIE